MLHILNKLIDGTTECKHEIRKYMLLFLQEVSLNTT